MHDYFDVQKVLVIAPLRVADSTWTDEAARWKHTRYLKMAKVLGSEAKRVQALNEKAHVYIINRENVAWLVEYYGRKWDFDMIVIDESSSFKSHAARRFKELKKVRPRAKRVAERNYGPVESDLSA
jgi:hypothetical protein